MDNTVGSRAMGNAAAAAREKLLEGGVEGLVDLVLDDIAARPLKDLVDADAVAGLWGDSLRSAAADPALAARIRDRLKGLVEAWDRVSPTAAPPEMSEPVMDVLRAPWTVDPTVMRALLDHRAVRNLTRDILTDSLLRFGRTLRSMVPTGVRPRGRLGRLAGVATGVASVAAGVLASEVERQLEGRVRDIMDEAIARATNRSVSYLSGRDAAADLGAWRAHILDTLRARSADEVRADVERLEREGLWAAVAEAVVEVAAWEGLDAHLAERVGAALEAWGDEPLGALLDADAPAWRDHLAGPLHDRARRVVRTEAFGAWLEDLLQG